MARQVFRRRNANGNQLKAIPMGAVHAAVVSLVTLAGYAVIISVSVYMAGETPRWLGGLGVIGFLVAIAAFVFNTKQLKTQTETRYRVICFAISLGSLLVWLFTFVLGMVT